MVHLVEHPDGVYLNMRFESYLADWALGSKALVSLLQEPAEWWWDSPFNTIDPQPKSDKSHFRLGTAVHLCFLEGMDLFKKIYGVTPTAADYPDALDTIPQLREACRARGLGVSGNKPDLIDRLVLAGAPVEILEVKLREWSRLGKIPLSNAEWSKVMLLYRQAMQNPNELATVGGDSVRLSDAFRGGLSEVTVIWTDENGIRQRCRFDKLHPNSTIDVKTFGQWTKTNFRKALLDEAVRRGYLLQVAHYEEGRRQLRRLVKEGKVFGGNEAELKELAAIAKSEAWAWIWVFMKTAGAPLIAGVRLDLGGLRFGEAVGQREAALANFISYRTFYGLEPGKMWFDPTDSIWEPTDEDFTAFATLGGS